MKITFLGTSHGLPEPNRKCSCTMIEVSGRIYFIDMGTPVTETLTTKHIPPESVKGVFITHSHGDHSDGLLDLVDLASWYYKSCNPEIFLPVIEYGDRLKDLLLLSGVTVRDEIKFSEVTVGFCYDDGFIKVKAYPTKHFEKAFSYLIEVENKKVFFSGDTEPPKTDFPEIMLKTRTDLAVFEGAHFPVTDYEEYFKKCDTDRFIINHYAPWNIPNIFRLSELLPDKSIITANDGMEINI